MANTLPLTSPLPFKGSYTLTYNLPDSTESLLDRDYRSLSLTDKNVYLIEILTGILGSCALNEEAILARNDFNDYEWTAKPDINLNDFNRLLEIGKNNDMTESDIDDFMELVSDSGQHHLYYLIRKGHHAIHSDNITTDKSCEL